jgi:hypothetical protein
MVGDNLNETPAAWTVDLVGVAKRLHWLAQRRKSWLGR